MRRRPVAVLAVLLAAGTMLLAWSQPWFALSLREGAVTGEPIAVGGDLAAPAVLAISLATAAVAAVLAIAGPRMRVVLGIAIALLGAGAVLAAVAVLVNPSAPFERVVAEELGIAGPAAAEAIAAAAATAWPVVAIAGGAAAAALGVLVAVRSREWPRSGRRYERGAGGAGGDDTIDAWDAISRGDDPTSATDRLDTSNEQETDPHER